MSCNPDRKMFYDDGISEIQKMNGCRRYLQKEIKGYLHKHLNLVPKVIVLMGLLQQPPSAQAAEEASAAEPDSNR